ncbi:MAG TPA: pyridoxal phosphate-dependent aminotransferase family protein [Verrucomicrobiae bacterium]|jgi:7-keto-8-aminopelargonate synthetase-like enzyme
MKEAEALEFIGENEVRWRGRTLEYFSGCDYFRLARNPRVTAAAVAALKASGLNVAASRFTTGNHQIYAQLETEIASFFGTETAVLFPDGYFAPLAVAQAFAGEFTHALVDELAHGALLDAARMLDCPLQKFKQRDAADLKKRLQKCGRKARPIILTDGMFSHDGSAAPLRAYLKLLPANGMMLVDDAHGAGVLGATGRGILEFENINRRRVVQCVTLSKAFGTYGGAVLATPKLREKILSRCRVFVGTTPLPPPLAGAALASLKLLRQESGRREKLFQNVFHLRAGLRAAGWDVAETPGPIVRLPLMNETEGGRLKKRLLQAGIYPPFLKYGATATGYFRFVISSQHTTAQLDKLIAVLAAFKGGA